MNYQQLMEMDKAFERFLHSYRGRNLIRIAYYQDKSKREFSFVGHKTSDGGYHGIHYNRKRYNFEFGTREGDNPWIQTLTMPQESKIPGLLRDALRAVVLSKEVKHVNYPKKVRKDDLN